MPKKKAAQPPPPAEPPPDEPPPPSYEPVPEPAPQQSNAKPTQSGLCGWHLLALLPILLAFAIYYLPTILDEYHARYGYGKIDDYDVPSFVMQNFHQYDANADGYIDPYEFMMVAQDLKLTDVNGVPLAESELFQFNEEHLAPGLEGLTVLTEFEPLQISSMSKFSNKQNFVFGTPEQMLPGLINWTKPAYEAHTFGVGNFKIFIPSLSNTFGEPYYIIEAEPSTRRSHMNLYTPPSPRGNEIFIHTLFSLFHPSVFVNCRFGPKGTVAILRAENSEYFDIIFRSHVEFQLNQEPNYPFWFTPSQFAGRLIITKDLKHIEFFEAYVPTDKSLNVDMEWITGPGNNEVDIGYLSKMMLYSANPSIVFNETEDVTLYIPDRQLPYDFNQFVWDQEISVEEAISKIEKTMYPFKEIPYLPLLDAVELAKKDNKLVHSILLWGALDDQSC